MLARMGLALIAQRSILGVTWSNDQAMLRIRDGNDTISALVPPIGLHLNYWIGAEPRRRCVGHISQTDGYRDCSSRPEPRSRTCTSCSIADAMFASQLHHAHNEPERVTEQAMLDHFQQPNVLYLAAFRDGSVKIGTSTATRVQKRLLEQGAWRAVLVAETTDGYVVRVAEDLITSNLGIPQSVSASRKLAGLANPLDEPELDERLEPLADRVRQLIGADADSGVVSTLTWWSNPAAQRSVWQQVRSYPLDPRRGAHDLEILDVVGRMVAARRTNTSDVFAIDLQKLYGIELAIGNHEPDELVIQDSLF